MMKIAYYGIVMLSLVMSGCTSSLKQWTDQELAPYLVKELGEHPRFKQQPIILLDMKGERVESDIDQLTSNIREQVFNTLLQSKGVNLNWQASVNSLQHHTRLKDLQCRPKQKNRYYIGFDLKPMNDQFQLSVKALDPEEGRWISGFGKTWQGSLSSLEQQLLSQTQPDEILRGLRPLPFTEQQMDILANYLAKNVSCLLQQSPIEQLTIYAGNTVQQPLFLKTTLALVTNYLSGFNEVQIVNKPELANIILKAQIHRIDKKLHQLWLIALDKQNDEYLKGIDTAAYVSLSDKALQVVSTQEKPSYPLRPVVASLPVQKPNSDVRPAVESAALFNKLDIIRPIGEPFCRTTNPWMMGEYVISKQQTVPYCFGISLSSNQQAEVFLVNEDSTGKYSQLLPDNGQSHFTLFAGETLRYPESNLFALESSVSFERIHAIAVSQPTVADKLRRILQPLPACCDEQGGDSTYWQSQLEHLQRQYNEFIDWQQLIIKN